MKPNLLSMMATVMVTGHVGWTFGELLVNNLERREEKKKAREPEPSAPDWWLQGVFTRLRKYKGLRAEFRKGGKPPDHYHGKVKRQPTVVRLGNRTFEVRVELPDTAPAGLRLRRETLAARVAGERDIPLEDADLDRLVQVQGDDEDRVAALLSYPGLADALRHLFVDELDVMVKGGEIIVRKEDPKPEHIQHAVEGAVTLALALGADKTIWDDLAEAHQLRYAETPRRRILRGMVDGAQVTVISERREDDGWTTEARVQVRGLSPTITLIRGTGTLGDPILDRFFRATGDAEALRALVASDAFGDARGELLEAADTWQTVAVQKGAVTIGEPDVPQKRMEAMVEATLAVAQALERATGG